MSRKPWKMIKPPQRRSVDWPATLIVAFVVVGLAVMTGELLTWMLFR